MGEFLVTNILLYACDKMSKLLWTDFQDKCILFKKKYNCMHSVISFLYKRDKMKLYIDLLLYHRICLRDFQVDRTTAAT